MLVLGEDRAAVELVCELATVIPGARGIYAGRLRNAGQVEAFAANLIAINRRYHAHAGISVTDLGESRHTLHIVSGKGGTGKTTIAAGLASALATRGRRVLLCEVEGRHGISEIFKVPPLRGHEERKIAALQPAVWFTGWPSMPRTPCSSTSTPSITSDWRERPSTTSEPWTSPPRSRQGLRDVLLTGKVYEAVRRGLKGRPNASRGGAGRSADGTHRAVSQCA